MREPSQHMDLIDLFVRLGCALEPRTCMMGRKIPCRPNEGQPDRKSRNTVEPFVRLATTAWEVGSKQRVKTLRKTVTVPDMPDGSEWIRMDPDGSRSFCSATKAHVG